MTPDWLWSCAERWERVDERLYPLGNNKLKARDHAAGGTGERGLRGREEVG